ncbi:MAG: addiction module protein [Cyanobacteria bacterium P01_D01_bin.36]
MQPLLAIGIEQISIAERIQLAEDLWDSILDKPNKLPVTTEQKTVLEQRLENHTQSPENVSSWQAVKDRLNNLQ